MSSEWTVFIITAVLLLFAMIAFTAAVIGANRFGFAMNRLHSAGIGDTLGLLCVIAALLAAGGIHIGSLKLILIVVFLWFTSPVSSHFLTQIEYYTNPDLYRIVKDETQGIGKGETKAEKKAETGE